MNMFSSESFGLSIGDVPVDLNKNKNIAGEYNIEANVWLPAAAKVYQISPRLEDYVVIPVIGLFSDIPNTNGDSVTLKEFLRFNPEMGMQAFKTFRGKPAFVEHANKDITKAKGVIPDAFLRKIKNFGGGRYWKLVLLVAYDRTKDPMLVNSILSGENNAYSVGFYYKAYTCSICNKTVGSGPADQPCNHTMPRRGTALLDDGSKRLVYRQCHDIVGFEISSVENPAYITAVSDILMDPLKV